MRAIYLTLGVLLLIYGICLGVAYVLSENHDNRHMPFVQMMGFSCRCSPPRSPAESLRTVALAQADYRANDRDGNGKADFWVDDVAGLYVSRAPAGYPMKLIEISLAAADADPVTPIGEFTHLGPKAGYWYKAIRHEGDAKADPTRFAVVSYPDGYPETGTMTYIIDETNTGWQKDLGHGNGVEVYPRDPAAFGWRRAN